MCTTVKKQINMYLLNQLKRETTMKNYYNLLQIFDSMINSDNVDEAILSVVSKSLKSAFNDLEFWEQDMLNKSISSEIADVLFH